MSQFVYLTPKPAIVPIMGKHRPYVFWIVVSNAICVLLHMLNARPEAGEATRGYLHGGLIIDFIGQEGPTSKIQLLLLDALVITLQFVMLAAHIQRQDLKTLMSSTSTTQPARGDVDGPVSTAQDLDAEERGILRPEIITEGDIEMQSLSPGVGGDLHHQPRGNGAADAEDDGLLAEPLEQANGSEDSHPLNVFHTGTVITADLYVLHTIQSQWTDYQNGSQEMSRSRSSASTGLAAALTGGRLVVRARVGGLDTNRL
jgi:hypothetical protein